MAAKKKISSSKEDAMRFAWLNPEVTLYFAYNMYVADDSTAKGTEAQRLAVKVVAQVQTWSARAGTRDSFYLAQVQSAIVSFARAVARHKRLFEQALEFAQKEHDGRQRNIIKGIGWTAVMAGAIRLGMLAVVFGIGFNLATTLSPFIPDSVSEETGKAPPSLLLGFTFVVLARMVGIVWEYYRHAHVNNRFHTRQELAWSQYNTSRLAEYRQHLSDLKELWHAYTGEKYDDVSTLETILQDDIRTRNQIARDRKRLDQWGTFGDFKGDVIGLLRRCLRMKKAQTVEKLSETKK